MHAIHTHEGVVLAKWGSSEDATRVALLTPERGLLFATARAARRSNAKLRFGLEPMTTARFSMVRGKHEWRLISVTDAQARPELGAEGRAVFGRVARLLLRMIRGEDALPAPELYTLCKGGFTALEGPGDARGVELLLVLRTLATLGYVPHNEFSGRFLGEKWDETTCLEALQEVRSLVALINDALQASQL